MRRALIMVSGILASAVIISNAEAATVLALTVEEMAQESDRVIRARVVSQDVGADERLGLVFRYTTLEVLEDLAGEGPSRVVLRQMGGLSGEQGVWIEGDASLQPGEEVVVFLSRGGPDGRLVHLVGLALGKFQIQRPTDEPIAVRQLKGLTAIRLDGEQKALERTISLEELRERIRGGIPPRPTDRGEAR